MVLEKERNKRTKSSSKQSFGDPMIVSVPLGDSQFLRTENDTHNLRDSRVLCGPQQIPEKQFLGESKKRVKKQNFLLRKENEAKSEVFDIENDIKRYEHFMDIAYKLALKSFDEGEIPIGAVIVKDDKIIGKGRNKRNKSKNALDHAEMIAIKKACKANGDWRLEGCDMYVTLMPCPMCAGAIVNARIENVIYAVESENQNLFEQIMFQNGLNHKTGIIGNVLREKCTKLLQKFFQSKRHK